MTKEIKAWIEGGAELSRKGEQLYRTQLKQKLEPRYKGKIACIEAIERRLFYRQRRA